VSVPRDVPADARRAAIDLLAYCRTNDWAGYDPYDALNSRVFRALPFLDFRLARLALTQGIKRSPVNLRPLLLVPRTPNPKGIALFLTSAVKLAKSSVPEVSEFIRPLAEKLLSLRSREGTQACWGYNFDWQQRFALVPKGSPNIICTTFAGNALLDASEWAHESSWRDHALSAADFILENLFSRESDGRSCFRYTLAGRDEVHNANLLGAAYLCRVSRITGNPRYVEPALEAARFSVARQHDDGSWAYGEAPTQQWIDNFHTGFNLVALRRIRGFTGTTEFDAAIRRGLDYYKAHFFRDDGAPKYFHDAVYPIDIHSAAQSIITLAEFSDSGTDNVALAHRVLGWTLRNMRSPKGYFYYQKRLRSTVRTPFMRWSQAWTLLALATLLESTEPAP